jgi:RHS repeat-associated protein
VNGAVNYIYDPVGNRKQITSTLAPVPAGLWNYDANDRFTAGDTYDNNGNTASSGGIANVYDFENHLIQKAGVTIVYDGDGNRVSKTVAGVTTTYLVDTLNSTGYAQVVYETFNGSSSGNYELNHSYVYGLELISQTRSYVANFQSATQKIYYVYDGHGSVRALTGPTGAITDTYDYDAFGNLIHSSTTLASPTPNNYLFAGEQFDPDLGLYYNRARYLNTRTGRFWSMDDYEGVDREPSSLHKYLYVSLNPIGMVDPSGNDGLIDLSAAQGILEELAGTLNTITNTLQTINRVRGTIDLVANIWQVVNTLTTGGASALIAGLPTFDPLAAKIDIEAALSSLAANGAKALGLAALQPSILEKVVEYFNAKDPAFILYMPLPSPSILIGTPLKVKGIPVKLFFGGGANQGGRLLGIGMLKNQSFRDPNLQIFRMDYHEFPFPPGSPGGPKDLVPPWTDGPFHYHIPVPN